MPIKRIEALSFGVDDLDASARFLADMGLIPAQGVSGASVFLGATNQKVTLHALDDASLPPAFEKGATLRLLTWGVDSEDDIEKIERELGSRAWRDEGGQLRVTDPNGLTLAFAVADETPAETVHRPHNQFTDIERINSTLESYGAPHPLRIVHVALNIRKADNDEALAFYTGPLSFKPVDSILDTGTFLQSEGDIEHHNFFLCHRPDKTGLNHFAVEVYDLDAVIEAGNHMIAKGWKESRRLGRHLIGSNAFRFFHAPFGGRIEFVADMDRMDKTWKTRVFEKNPGHHQWMLKSGTGGADG